MVRRPAACHDPIDGDLLHSRDSSPRRHDANSIVGSKDTTLDHPLDGLGCRSDQGKTVAPTLSEEPGLQLRRIGWNDETFRLRRQRGEPDSDRDPGLRAGRHHHDDTTQLPQVERHRR